MRDVRVWRDKGPQSHNKAAMCVVKIEKKHTHTAHTAHTQSDTGQPYPHCLPLTPYERINRFNVAIDADLLPAASRSACPSLMRRRFPLTL